MSDMLDADTSARPSDRDRRKDLRRRCFLPGQLLTAAGSFDCRVLDFSRGGAKVEAELELAEAQPVTLVVQGIGTHSGLVTWRRGGCFGVRFLTQQEPTRASPAARAAAVRSPGQPAQDPDSEADGCAPSPALVDAEIPGVAASCDMPGARVSPPAAEVPVTLKPGDIGCLLRRKTGGGDRKNKATPCASAVAAKTDCRLVEIDARRFAELIEQNADFSITLLQATASGARRSRKTASTDKGASSTDVEHPQPDAMRGLPRGERFKPAVARKLPVRGPCYRDALDAIDEALEASKETA